MVVIEVEVDGEPTEIAIHRDGSFEFLNYDIEPDIMAVELGDDPTEAFLLFQFLMHGRIHHSDIPLETTMNELELDDDGFQGINNGLLFFLVSRTCDELGRRQAINYSLDCFERLLEQPLDNDFMQEAIAFIGAARGHINMASPSINQLRKIYRKMAYKNKGLYGRGASWNILSAITGDDYKKGPRGTCAHVMYGIINSTLLQEDKLWQLNRYMDYLEGKA